MALFIALGAGIGFAALAIAFLVARGIGDSRAATGSETAASPETVPTSTGNSIELGNDPPVVNVDSLPVSSSRAPNPVPGMGFITIAASPGKCSVAIDGTNRGWTPLSQVALPTGPHSVQCFPASGKPHSMTVIVAEGTMSKFRFDLGGSP
jgi:hypothetical protein